MSYQIEIDFTPAYELVSSFQAFARRNNHKVLEGGASWAKSVKKSLTNSFVMKLSAHKYITDTNLELLIWQCPNRVTADQFLIWLEKLTMGELYELLAEWMDTVPSDLGDIRSKSVELLSEWNEQYFKTIDPAILQGLSQDAVEKRKMIPHTPPIELMDLATNGFRLNPTEGLERVILIPQYHLRPGNTSSFFSRVSFTRYPVDALPTPADEPTPALMRVAQGLADQNRLRMLKFVLHESKTFTELVRFSGLSKSTVHYHLILLRAAGLIRVTMTGSTVEYSLRQEALEQLNQQLGDYLTKQKEREK